MNTSNRHIDPAATLASTVRLRLTDDATITVGAHCTVADNVEIEIAEEGVIHIGDHVAIGPNAVLRGHGDIRIDTHAVIDAGAVIDTREAAPVSFATCDPSAFVKRPVRIGAGARIGANAVIRPGVTIGAHAVVPPCTFVTTDVADRTVASHSNGEQGGRFECSTPHRRFLFGFSRWHETARHFVTLANTIRAANVDSRIYGTPLTLSRLPYLRPEQAIAHDDIAEMERVLDEWQPDCLIVWSGATQLDQALVAAARRRSIDCRFAELGWFPQSKTIHFDKEGTNARSSMRRFDLDGVHVDPRFDDWLSARRSALAEPPPDIRNYVFVPLQDIRDANITLGSPYRSMGDFVTALAARFPSETFVVRPHPNFSDVPLTPHDNVVVRRDRSIHPWLQHADAVVGINSTALLEALVYGIPTHAVGTGLATGLDVLFEARDVTELEIQRDIPEDRWDRTRRLLSELVFVRQAWMKDLHYLDRLPRIFGLGDLFDARTARHRATSSPQSALPAQS